VKKLGSYAFRREFFGLHWCSGVLEVGPQLLPFSVEKGKSHLEVFLSFHPRCFDRDQRGLRMPSHGTQLLENPRSGSPLIAWNFAAVETQVVRI